MSELQGKSLISKMIRRLRGKVDPDHVIHEGVILPPPETRYGGRHFKDNAVFLQSGEREVRRLIDFCGLSADSTILEIGCGRGRLPISIARSLGSIRHYVGLDVDKRSIEWCQQYISSPHPAFTFVHLDVRNERYNPNGGRLDEEFSFPLKAAEFDIIYLYSVFSHLEEKDVTIYLKEFKRVLASNGTVFVTAFVQEGVPHASVNPTDYVMDWSGPLHCVRYETDFLISLFEQAGFAVAQFDYETETDKQSAFSLRPSAPRHS